MSCMRAGMYMPPLGEAAARSAWHFRANTSATTSSCSIQQAGSVCPHGKCAAQPFAVADRVHRHQVDLRARGRRSSRSAGPCPSSPQERCGIAVHRPGPYSGSCGGSPVRLHGLLDLRGQAGRTGPALMRPVHVRTGARSAARPTPTGRRAPLAQSAGRRHGMRRRRPYRSGLPSCRPDLVHLVKGVVHLVTGVVHLVTGVVHHLSPFASCHHPRSMKCGGRGPGPAPRVRAGRPSIRAADGSAPTAVRSPRAAAFRDPSERALSRIPRGLETGDLMPADLHAPTIRGCPGR